MKVYNVDDYRIEKYDLQDIQSGNYEFMIYSHSLEDGVIVAKGVNGKFGFLAIRGVEKGTLSYHFSGISPECVYELKDVLRILRRALKTSQEYYKYRYEAECINNAILKLKELEGLN